MTRKISSCFQGPHSQVADSDAAPQLLITPSAVVLVRCLVVGSAVDVMEVSLRARITDAAPLVIPRS